VADFATSKAGMILWQSGGPAFKARGMTEDQWGVAPVPFPASPPAGGKKINSMVAGINMAVFKFTKNQDGALKFVKFMTSDAEQATLNKTYGSLPSVATLKDDPTFSSPEQKVSATTLATTAAPLPQVAGESQFETLVGTAMKDLFADAAGGKTVSADQIKKALSKAQEQVK
jgi:multiple sugar transport system substrate-binding protein